MQSLAFADATRPTPRRILRVPLLDYSIGHELLLQRGRNLLVDGTIDTVPEDEQRAAIIKAIMICSRTWEQNKKPDRWLTVWGWFLRFEDFNAAIEEFKRYRSEGTTLPQFAIKKESNARKLGSPLMAMLLDYSTLRFGKSALDQPLGTLLWMFYAHRELEGDVEIENELERQTREELERHDADYKKEQEAKCQS